MLITAASYLTFFTKNHALATVGNYEYYCGYLNLIYVIPSG